MPWAAASAEKTAVDRIRRIRQLDDKRNFTLVCPTFPSWASMPRSTPACSACSRHTPVPTFILSATREVPRISYTPSARTIGLRVPELPIARALLEELGSR